MNLIDSISGVVVMGVALLMGGGCTKHEGEDGGHEHGAACSHGAAATEAADDHAGHDHTAAVQPSAPAKAGADGHEHGAACSHGAAAAAEAADDHAGHDHTAAAQPSAPAKAGADGHEHGAACSHGAAAAEAADDHAGHDHGEEAQKTETAFEVSENVRRLLGITYATAARRSVRGSARFPGRFELMPGARRIYGTVSPGVAEVCVRPNQRVRKGDTLFRIASPEWARQTGAKREADAAVAVAQTEAEAIRARLLKLSETGVRNAELEMALKMKEAEVARAESVRQSAESLHRSVLSLCREESGSLVFEARDAGVVERVSADSGAWLDAGAEVVSVAREEGVWFRADGAAAEMPRVRDGQPGFVEPLRRAAGDSERVDGVVSLGWLADADARIRPVYLTLGRVPPWATPGTAGILSVTVEQSAADSVAVPLACVLPDGLRRVLFARDEKDPDRFVKKEVVLGADDGEWVEVQGVAAGTTVVLDGAYELKLATPSAASAAPKKAGHFHADGQFYEDTH